MKSYFWKLFFVFNFSRAGGCWFWLPQASWASKSRQRYLRLTGCPSLLPGSDHRVVGLCCLKQVGFQAGGNPTWCGPNCFSDTGSASKWGWSYLRVPSSCHGYGLNCLSEFQLPSRGDPASGNLNFASSATLAAVGFGLPKQAGGRQWAERCGPLLS